MNSSEIFFMIFIISTTLFFLLIKKKTTDINTSKLPPGPRKLPIIGNLHQLGKLPHRSLKNLSKLYGDLMFLQLGSIPTLVVSSPSMAREIYKSYDLILSARPPLYAAKLFSYDFSSLSFAPHGEYWRELRKIVTLELMTAKRVQSFGLIRVQEVAFMINHITGHVKKPVNLSALAFALTNNIISRVAFGYKSDVHHGKSEGEFWELINETQHLAAEFNVADYFPGMGWVNKFNGVDRRLNKNFRDLDRFLDKVIKEHVDDEKSQGDDDEDIIDVLIRIQKDTSQKLSLTSGQLKGVLLDIFLAGSETSAATIVWTMSELIRNPLAQKKAQQEVRKVAQGKPKIDENDIPKLTYLKLVIKESFRLHPPAPLLIPRETMQHCTIAQKYEIPAKTRVFFNVSAISTDPKHWEDPEKFLPERFLDSQIDFRGQHFELLPFGAGRRSCPGINFSIPVVELALANILLCFDWELPKGMGVEDLDMEEALGITMHKKTPLCLVASPMIYI